MKTVRYEISVFMVTEAEVTDLEALHLAATAKGRISESPAKVADELGLEECHLLEGRFFVDGAESTKVYGRYFREGVE